MKGEKNDGLFDKRRLRKKVFEWQKLVKLETSQTLFYSIKFILMTRIQVCTIQ